MLNNIKISKQKELNLQTIFLLACAMKERDQPKRIKQFINEIEKNESREFEKTLTFL